MTVSGLAAYLRHSAKETDRALKWILGAARVTGPLKEALGYSLFPGGKRFRPALFMAAYTALGGDEAKGWMPAASLELAHTFTLLQDDLPAFDNDDYRRGKPTVHKKFGESSAILVSDLLLLLAFRELATSEFGAETRARGAVELADALGAAGVIGGQHDDLRIEIPHLTLPQLLRINRRKTGALMKCAARLGAVFAGADDADIQRLGEYGENVGAAFQIADDLADKEDELRLCRSKVSIPALRRTAESYVRKAVALVQPIGSEHLTSLAEFALRRTR